MVTIAKEFHFSASHQLLHLPHDHPCARLHGHNYVAVLELSGSIDKHTGFVLDYRELDAFKSWIDSTLDHQHLNNVVPNLWIDAPAPAVGAALTTAEHLAALLFWKAQSMFGSRVTAVRLSETPKTWAEYRG